ncbi:MAG: hypothetical protein DRI57_07300, partial [Deltaproteobacteria bacterium]
MNTLSTPLIYLFPYSMKQATDRLLPANPVRQDNQKTECQVGIIIRKQNVTDGVANPVRQEGCKPCPAGRDYNQKTKRHGRGCKL